LNNTAQSAGPSKSPQTVIERSAASALDGDSLTNKKKPGATLASGSDLKISRDSKHKACRPGLLLAAIDLSPQSAKKMYFSFFHPVLFVFPIIVG